MEQNFLEALYLDDGPGTEALGIDMDQAVADFVVFQVGPVPQELQMVGGTITESVAGTTSKGQFKFDIRPTAGSDVSRGDGDAGSLDCTGATAGQVLYDDTYAGLVLNPGEEVVCQMTTRSEGTAAGHIRPFVMTRPLDEEPANIDAMVSSPITD